MRAPPDQAASIGAGRTLTKSASCLSSGFFSSQDRFPLASTQVPPALSAASGMMAAAIQGGNLPSQWAGPPAIDAHAVGTSIRCCAAEAALGGGLVAP
jgi:hypothetical protein